MATEIYVNIGSDNGLLPDGTKPLPELMLTCQWDYSALPNKHTIMLIISPYSKDQGMLWFYVEAARRPPPTAHNGVNAITQKPRDGLFSNLVYTLVVIVSWPD